MKISLSDVVNYFDWLGAEVEPNSDRQARFKAAARVVASQEKALTDVMIHGTGNLIGLAKIKGVNIIGGLDNPAREGLVGFWIDGVDSAEIVKHLNNNGVRTHLRKADHYSSNILTPLGQSSCIRVSTCHYNSVEEVAHFLQVMKKYA